MDKTKVLVVGAFAIVLVSLLYYLYPHREPSAGIDLDNVTEKVIRVPYESDTRPENVTSFGQDTSIRIGALEVRGALQQARNPGSEVYVSGTRIGEIEGAGLVSSTKSHTGKRVLLETIAYSGAADSARMYYLVDLETKTVSRIMSPKTAFDGDISGLQDKVAKPVLVFKAWDGENPEFSLFFVGSVQGSGQRVRVSAEEVWVYNSAFKTLMRK